MNKNIEEISSAVRNDMLTFASDLVKIKSFTGDEEQVVKRVEKEMKKLGYDEITKDKMGNIIGRIGSGKTSILYDGHVDTVSVDDANEWVNKPFGGDIVDNKLYGRGTTDMKCSVAAMVYAGYAAKKLGLDKDVTMYISASIMEEDCDGAAILYEYDHDNIHPDYVVICEPSELKLAVGQRGRTSIKITIDGVPCHGSQPEKGVNPVYKMMPIIQRIEELGKKFIAGQGNGGSLALTKVDCITGSLNSVPSKCCVYLDRRLSVVEDRDCIKDEMEGLIEGTDAYWEIITYEGKSYTGEDVITNVFYPAWSLDREHNLTKSAVSAYKELFDRNPEIFKWNFSTNGVASMGQLKIPTIGFGPGICSMAHQKDEYCPVENIVEALKFYTLLPKYI